MMGPHWNPKATEFAIVTQGQGVVQVIGPTDPSGELTRDVKRKNSLYQVKEGDVFIVPKFHPMTHISFNNDSFVFVGFSTNARNNYPQFLAGGRSVLKEIDKEILKEAFNAPNSTVVEKLLSSQRDVIILGCTSCAEDLVKKAEKEEERKEEEERRREEKERRREEEKERRRREEEEEEEARRREEEEESRRRREEEEESRKREEREARKREEERSRREEEAKRREEKEARRREEEEEEARRREEEARRREEEEKEKARRREEEEGEEWIRKKLRSTLK